MSDINQMYFLVLVTILILTHCTSLSFSQLSMTMSVVSSPSTVSVLSYVSSVTYNKYKKTGLRICFWAKRCDRHANALTCRFLFCLFFYFCVFACWHLLIGTESTEEQLWLKDISSYRAVKKYLPLCCCCCCFAHSLHLNVSHHETNFNIRQNTVFKVQS